MSSCTADPPAVRPSKRPTMAGAGGPWRVADKAPLASPPLDVGPQRRLLAPHRVEAGDDRRSTAGARSCCGLAARDLGPQLQQHLHGGIDLGQPSLPPPLPVRPGPAGGAARPGILPDLDGGQATVTARRLAERGPCGGIRGVERRLIRAQHGVRTPRKMVSEEGRRKAGGGGAMAGGTHSIPHA